MLPLWLSSTHYTCCYLIPYQSLINLKETEKMELEKRIQDLTQSLEDTRNDVSKFIHQVHHSLTVLLIRIEIWSGIYLFN